MRKNYKWEDAIDKNDVISLVRFCKDHLDLDNIELSSEYGYPNVPLCIIDAVFSIGVRYTSTQNTVSRFCEFLGGIHDSESDRSTSSSQLSVSDFIWMYDKYGIEGMAERVYGNRQRTSVRSGILKAEAALLFAKTLSRFGIEYINDVEKLIGNREFEGEIMNIPGQRSGLSLRYFYMLTGSENLVKPDRMINRFVSSAIGRQYGLDETTKLLVKACEILKEEYPGLTPRLLDNSIWKYQRNQR